MVEIALVKEGVGSKEGAKSWRMQSNSTEAEEDGFKTATTEGDQPRHS